MRRLLALVLPLMLAGACAPFPYTSSRPSVVVMGDSILGLAKDELAPQLDGWSATINYANGSGLTAGTIAATGRNWSDVLRVYEAAYGPDVVVVVLGTNDAEAVASGVDYGPLVDQLLRRTSADRVLWATCSTRTAVETRNRGCALIADVLRARRLEIVPYDPEVTSLANFGGVDSIHPGPGGQAALADLIAQSVGEAG